MAKSGIAPQTFLLTMRILTGPQSGSANNVSNSLYMSYQNPGGERVGSEPIASEKVAIERKIFFLDLKENQRGRFLKITEDVGGRRDTIMLPAPAFKDFLEALQRLVEFEAKL